MADSQSEYRSVPVPRAENRDEADQRGFIETLLADGRPLLSFTGLSLILSGLFALFLATTGSFLPHDVQFLGMQPEELCAIHECRIVHFMIHDRVSFGGSLIAIGTLYLWLSAFPLRQRVPWAWWLFALSGLMGFTSFLTYLGYGYLDTWHGISTLGLLPLFLVGLIRSYQAMPGPLPLGSLLRPFGRPTWTSGLGFGRACLLATSIGMVAGGFTIMTVGMTHVFVPQDLEFMGLSVAELQSVNPRLIPLIAHDRAGFGGGVCTCGVTMFFILWCGTPSRSLWQAVALSGAFGFGTAILVHPVIGYNSFTHLFPAFAGAFLFLTGLALTLGPMWSPGTCGSPTVRTAPS
jgi:hypothetical protein